VWESSNAKKKIMVQSNLDRMLSADLWVEILKFTDVGTLGCFARVCTCFSEMIREYKWDVIDKIEERQGPTCLIPNTKETYENYRYVIDWAMLVYKQKKHIPEKVIEELCDELDMGLVSIFQRFSEDLLRKIHDKIPFTTMLLHQKVPIDLLEELIEQNRDGIDRIQWNHICRYQPLTMDFIIRNEANIDWFILSENKNALTCDLIDTFSDRLLWPELTKHGLNEKLIEMRLQRGGGLDYFSWVNVASVSCLSVSFIRKHHKSMPLSTLFHSQKLDETMIEYLVSTVSDHEMDEIWRKIASHQHLSEAFIKRYKDKLQVHLLVRNSKVKRKALKNVYG
jgi:hypothetical protein